jgi:RND family efflux transporter MFP subunit
MQPDNSAPLSPPHKSREDETNDNRSHSEYPDQISRAEHGRMSTQFAPETGRQLKFGATVAAGALLLCLLIVSVVRILHARSVARSGEAAYSAPPPVDVVIAHPVTGSQELVLPGETAAWYESTIYARVNGYVGNWFVDIGDHVKKGQLLATIETPDLDAQLAAARAQLKSSQALVVARQAEAEFARTTNERWRDAPKGVVSEQEREQKKADYDAAKAHLYAANAQENLDKSKVDQFDALAEFKQVRAPYDGTITERKIDVGNLVTAGSTSTTSPLYRMAQTDPLRIFVDVPQNAARDLMNPGVPAEIRATGSVGVFSGKIARSARAIDVQARTMKVEVDMPNAQHSLVPGMYVTVGFRLEPRGNVEVPAAALIFRANGAQVAKVDANNRVQFENVVIGRDDGTMVELASGVQPGERLVLNISNQIAPAQLVSVREPETTSRPLGAKR